jgi:carbon-monoxide dehydrogenase iron sulfur subunit
LEAPCVDACISGAMNQDASTGRVTVDSKQCVACWSCVMSCPFAAVSPQEKNHFALKCDICEDEILPCVKACKPGALIQSERQANLTKLTQRANAAARSLRFARLDSRK